MDYDARNIRQCRKMDIVRIMTTGEEKPVISFNSMRMKADKELFIIPNVGMSKRNAHLAFLEVGFVCFESREKTQHGSTTLFQDWQCLAVSVRWQLRGSTFH